MSKFIAQAKADSKKIAGDILSIAVSLAAVLAVVSNVSNTVHLPAWANAAIAPASSVVATIILQARRYSAAQKAPAPKA